MKVMLRFTTSMLFLVALCALPRPAVPSEDPAGPPLQFQATLVDGGAGGESSVELSWVTPVLDPPDQLPVFNVPRRDDTTGGSFIAIIATQSTTATDPVRALPGPNCHVMGDGLCAQPGHTYTYAVSMNYFADGCFGGTTYTSAPATPVTVTIPGGEPRLEVIPATLDFGEVASESTAESTVRVRNTSDSAVVVRPSKLKKPFALADTKPFILTAGEAKFVTVRATPTKSRAGSATLRFETDTLPAAEAALAVQGIPPIRVSRAIIDFGSVRGSAPEAVDVTNLRDRPVRVRLGGLRTPFSIDGPATFTLGPSETRTVVVLATTLDRPPVTDFLTIAALPGSDVATVELKVRGERDVLVRTVTGDVTVRRASGGDPVPLTAGTILGEGDEIFTGVESEAELAFEDGSQLRVEELSQIALSLLMSSGQRQRVLVNLAIGRAAAKINPQKTFQSDFKVQTPGATAGVRGTEFDVTYDPATETTTVRVLEGVVLVTPDSRRLKRVKVRANQLVTVTPTTISPVGPYTPE